MMLGIVDNTELTRSHTMNGGCSMNHIFALACGFQKGWQKVGRVTNLQRDLTRGLSPCEV